MMMMMMIVMMMMIKIIVMCGRVVVIVDNTHENRQKNITDVSQNVFLSRMRPWSVLSSAFYFFSECRLNNDEHKWCHSSASSKCLQQL